MSGKNKPNELSITRVYDASVRQVWEAWTDPAQVAQWWGPRGFSITTHHKDLRPGGTWDYTMHGPDGTNYENTTNYLEVEKYARLVYDHGGLNRGKEHRPALFRVTVLFSELPGGRTQMEMTMALPTAEAAAEAKKFIKKAGGDGTWDRLAEFLAPSERFVINRTFEVSRAQMFKLWTDPKHFSQWLPPTGATMEFIEVNIQPGGTSFYKMIATQVPGPDPLTMYGKITYREIQAPERLVYTQIFCDKDGRASRHPLAPTWPETMLTTVTFFEEEPHRTRVCITWDIHGPATALERETFTKAKTGMSQGWGGSFEKLDAYLGSLT